MPTSARPCLLPEMCRARQRRLLDAVCSLGVDLIVLSRIESIQWLTGWRASQETTPVAVIDGNGHVLLVLPERDINVIAAVDERVTYESVWHGTLRHDQRAASSTMLVNALARPCRVACEFAAVDQHLIHAWQADFVDIEPVMFILRRHKDHDELAMMRCWIEANRAMYARARELMRPDTTELTLFNELQTAAVNSIGEPLTCFGQDFRCGTRGGPPRVRRIEHGELYILDLGVGYRGYFSDNARTFVVGGEPTADQFRAWQQVNQIFPLIEDRVRPGARCRPIYDEVERTLNRNSPWVFDHHLGHGLGLAPHEAPHLNPHWNDSFEVGDVFAVEPGLYHPDLRAGVRLEQNYRVTESGVELLSDWPTDL